MTEYASYWGWRDEPGIVARRLEMFGLVGTDRVLEGLFVKMCGYETPPTGELKGSYTPAQAVHEVQKLQGDMIRIYTGIRDWILVARELSKIRFSSKKVGALG